MNKGGTQTVGDMKVTMVHADHSCGIQDGDEIVYGGEACGYVIEFSERSEDLPCRRHQRLRRHGDHPRTIRAGNCHAAHRRSFHHGRRAKPPTPCKLLKPKTVIPMHFGTFPH